MAHHIHTESTTELFQELVQAAIDHQKLNSSKSSAAYLVQVLDGFVDPGRVPAAPEKALDTPIAKLFLEAFHYGGMEQFSLLKLSGDLALFTAGFFSDHLQDRAVDIDYYCRLGGSAYACAADTCRCRETAALFAELSNEFVSFVDVLSEVSETCTLTNSDNLLRLYEKWQQTGSNHSREQLRRRGILVVPGSDEVH